MINTYAVDIRRKLHMYPELSFDLDRTLALLKTELENIGVEYTEQYGKSSIVATVNPEKSHYTIGIRADMDALPITEENDVEYKSRIEGKMHACGHDAHTAIALTALKELYEMRDKINCRVRFLFQSAEETYCGAKFMADDGVMEDIDCIIALHVDANCRVGEIMLDDGPINANADHFLLEFFGKAAHVARQQNGIDANMMAIKAYTAIEFLMAKEVGFNKVALFNAGQIHGGTASNNISDYCRMNCTLRTWDDETAGSLLEKIEKTTKMTAQMSGGNAKFTLMTHYPILVNDREVTLKLRSTAEKVVGEDHILPFERSTGAEDFACFTRLKPGCMFRLGVANENREPYATHTSKFDIDENALDIGVKIFKQFVLDHMNGEIKK